jgi:UDP-N-acetylmuramyl pentapeptide phosphotransferase/UDP-N-acetylglucosamine-1-phosphate transferase
MDALQSVALTALLSALLTGLATWYSTRRGLLDHPGQRHTHQHPTPRGGGAGLVLALLLVSLWLARPLFPSWWSVCVAPGLVLLAGVGWWDDHRPLSARIRFAVQLLACGFLLWCAVRSGWMGETLAVILAGIFILWMTNLYNFMDGSNGMAGLQGVYGGFVLAWLFAVGGDMPSALVAAAVASACLGFLPWNLGQARVFMGDVGSLVLGFTFGAMIVFGVASGAFALPVGLMVMSLFLTDSTLTLLVRVMKGERWYNAHRQHLYQRLIVRGWTHGRVALLYQVINLALVVPGIALAVKFPQSAWLIALAMALVFSLGWYLIIKKIGVFARAE